MLTAFFVAARILANPVSNVFQKQLTQRGAGPIFIIGATHALLTLVCLPLLAASPPLSLTGAFWMNMLTAALLAAGGNVLLVFALQTADLSVLGPINAYKSVVSLLLGIFLVGEIPTAAGVAGVLLIVAGSYVAAGTTGAFSDFLRDRGIQFRLGALVLSATEAIFLKRVLLLSSPMTTFLLWSILGLPIVTLAALLLKEPLKQEAARFRTNWLTYVWLAATTGLMQLATLLTFGAMQVGYSLALFQLSTLVSVFLGYRYFREANIRRRLLAALIMASGATLIFVQGQR